MFRAMASVSDAARIDNLLRSEGDAYGRRLIHLAASIAVQTQHVEALHVWLTRAAEPRRCDRKLRLFPLSISLSRKSRRESRIQRINSVIAAYRAHDRLMADNGVFQYEIYAYRY